MSPVESLVSQYYTLYLREKELDLLIEQLREQGAEPTDPALRETAIEWRDTVLDLHQVRMQLDREAIERGLTPLFAY